MGLSMKEETKEKDIIKIKPNKTFLVLLLIVATWFYWFQIRPSRTRKICHKTAMQKAIDKVGYDNKWYKKDYDAYYDVCLNKHGLK